MMKPRRLHYLRIDDEPPRPREDIVGRLPVETENLTEWFEFAKRLGRQRPWEYELITIDFNFKEDRSGPWFSFPGLGTEDYNADFRKDPVLSQLGWSDRLDNIGPNSGLLIGAHMVSYSNYRDIPSGVAFHTYHPLIVIRDMSSAMLAAQILVASGAQLPARSLSEFMRAVIDMVQESSGRYRPSFVALGEAAARFRQAFLGRAGVGETADESEVRLWMEPSSLWNLLDIFQAARTEKELDEKLDKFGIEFYDRDGKLHSLDLRSMLLDRLIYKDREWNVREYLPLGDVKPAANDQPEAGVLWQFIETLSIKTPANIAPVLEYFRRYKKGEETGTINVAVKRKVHRLIALIFAWLDQYAELWVNSQSISWDPFTGEFDGSLPPMTTQVSALLRIIDSAREKMWLLEPPSGEQEGTVFDPRSHFLPLSGKGGHTITALVREQCAPESLLHRALGYHLTDSPQLSQKRTGALARMLSIAEGWGNVTEERDAAGKRTGRYRVNHLELPPQRPLSPLQADLAQRLGFEVKPGDDPSTQLKRIIQSTPGYSGVGVMEFLNSLEERPLPSHFKWLGWEFMEEFWQSDAGPSLPYEAWPLCLSEAGGTSENSTSLVEWRRKMQRSHDAARQVQAVIMPSPLLLSDDRCEIWCWRRPAEEVSGDYYHVREEGPGQYRIYVGDVCGKGLAAALLVQEIHGAIKALEEQSLLPEEVCARLDGKLYERAFDYPQQGTRTPPSVSNRWATLVCAHADFESKTLTYANAGHPAPIIVRHDGSTHALNSQSRPVGLLPNGDYRSETVALTPGDRLLFFSDGLSEVLEGDLIECGLNNRRLSAEELGKLLIEKAKVADGQADDITLVVVSVN